MHEIFPLKEKECLDGSRWVPVISKTEMLLMTNRSRGSCHLSIYSRSVFTVIDSYFPRSDRVLPSPKWRCNLGPFFIQIVCCITELFHLPLDLQSIDTIAFCCPFLCTSAHSLKLSSYTFNSSLSSLLHLLASFSQGIQLLIFSSCSSLSFNVFIHAFQLNTSGAFNTTGELNPLFLPLTFPWLSNPPPPLSFNRALRSISAVSLMLCYPTPWPPPRTLLPPSVVKLYHLL